MLYVAALSGVLAWTSGLRHRGLADARATGLGDFHVADRGRVLDGRVSVHREEAVEVLGGAMSDTIAAHTAFA